MDINYQYNKLRRSFGRQPLYCEAGPALCDSIAPDMTLRKHYILRNPVHTAAQHAPPCSEHLVNTVRAEYSNAGANHAEGGWPRDVAVTDPEATQRYRRKIEKEDNYIHCVMANAPDTEHYILQNNAIDMYRTYYAEMGETAAPERVSVRTVNVYRAGGGPRPVVAISWQPDGGRRLAVAHADLDCDRSGAVAACHVWDVENATSPELTLVPPHALLDLQFNARDAAMLAGALASGQVGVWDRRAGATPRLLSAPHVAHRDLARRVLFINAKSGREFFSAGADGCVKWWDARDMSEPTEEMIIDVVKYSFDVQSLANASGVSALEFEPTIPTRFMVGTEDGSIVGGNRKGKTALEKLPFKFPAHHGPVRSLERNPGFLKNFLSVGDWTVRVWSEDCRESSILMSPPQRHRLTSAAWSPTRLSLMVVTQWDGCVALWDLLRRRHAPTLAMHVCDEPLLTARPHEQGSLIALGSLKGNVYMTELSHSLAQSDKNDKALLTLHLEREAKRERILEARTREIRLKQRQAEEGGGAETERPSDTDLAAIGDRDLAEAGATYLQAVRRELALM